MQAQVADTHALGLRLQEFWGELMRTSSDEWFRTISALDLSLTQIKLLHLLAKDEEDLSVGAVAERIGLSLPAVSRAVDGLAKRDLLARRECEHDRRSRLLRLTPHGRDVLEQVRQARLAGLTEFVERLPDSRRAALAAALDALLEDPAP